MTNTETRDTLHGANNGKSIKSLEIRRCGHTERMYREGMSPNCDSRNGRNIEKTKTTEKMY